MRSDDNIPDDKLEIFLRHENTLAEHGQRIRSTEARLKKLDNHLDDRELHNCIENEDDIKKAHEMAKKTMDDDQEKIAKLQAYMENIHLQKAEQKGMIKGITISSKALKWLAGIMVVAVIFAVKYAEKIKQFVGVE